MVTPLRSRPILHPFPLQGDFSRTLYRAGEAHIRVSSVCSGIVREGYLKILDYSRVREPGNGNGSIPAQCWIILSKSDCNFFTTIEILRAEFFKIKFSVQKRFHEEIQSSENHFDNTLGKNM